MENNQQNTPNHAPVKNKEKMIVIAAVVVAIALVVGTVGTIALTGQNPSSASTDNQNAPISTSSPQSGIKVGGYATYQGQASIMGIEVDFNAKMQIVDLNSTHFEVATDVNMSTPFGNNENQTTTWVSKENLNFQPPNMTLNNTYNAQVSVAKLGTRNCTVYEYSTEDISATYYVDNKVGWPVKMVMTSPTSVDGQTFNMDINLVDTNIPGL